MLGSKGKTAMSFPLPFCWSCCSMFSCPSFFVFAFLSMLPMTCCFRLCCLINFFLSLASLFSSRFMWCLAQARVQFWLFVVVLFFHAVLSRLVLSWLSLGFLLACCLVLAFSSMLSWPRDFVLANVTTLSFPPLLYRIGKHFLYYLYTYRICNCRAVYVGRVHITALCWYGVDVNIHTKVAPLLAHSAFVAKV